MAQLQFFFKVALKLGISQLIEVWVILLRLSMYETPDWHQAKGGRLNKYIHTFFGRQSTGACLTIPRNIDWQHRTKVIVLHEAEVPHLLPHGDLLHSALVQGELLGYIYVTVETTGSVNLSTQLIIAAYHCSLCQMDRVQSVFGWKGRGLLKLGEYSFVDLQPH